jgi:hypothetical protein
MFDAQGDLEMPYGFGHPGRYQDDGNILFDAFDGLNGGWRQFPVFTQKRAVDIGTDDFIMHNNSDAGGRGTIAAPEELSAN